MTYTPPSLFIEQELVSTPDSNALPLYACILAPRYGLHRFGVEGEQALLGAYDADLGNTFIGWPGRVVGSTIDVGSSVVKIKDAVLQYFNTAVDGSVDPTHGVLENDGNRIRFPNHILKTANGYARSASFGTRDVALGDRIRVTFGSTTVDSVVSGLVADVDPATVSNATPDAGNAAASAAGNSVDDNSLSVPGTLVIALDETGFTGLAYGYPEETYILTVKTAGAGNKIPGTVFTVQATNGDDNGEITIAAYNTPVEIGNQGATITFGDGGAGDGTETVNVNDTVTVTVSTDNVVPTLEGGGNFLGLKDTTYIVTVEQGGIVGTDVVKISALSIHGYDASVTATVTPDLYNAIGTQGATLQFQTAETLVTGDKYLVVVTAAGAGAIRTIIMRDKLVGAVTTDVLDITLSLVDTIDLGVEYWTANASQIVLAAAATYTGLYLGVATAHNILGGNAYVDYRELLVANANKLLSLDDVLDVEDTLGPAVEENPLSLMVKAALTPANGTRVYYIQLASDDLAGYTAAAGVQDYRLEPYSLVPYSTDTAVNDVIKASVDKASAKDRSLYRILVRGADVPVFNAFYTEDALEAPLLATLIGTDLVTTNGTLQAAGVRAGDTVHINYRPDNKGGIIYDSYVIDTVISDTEATVVEAPLVDIGTAVKFEVWRTSTGDEYAEAVAAIGQYYTDRRVCVVWSDKLTFGGIEGVSNAVLAAMIAGLRSAVAPHQPLSNYPLSNISVEDTLTLTGDQLNTMAAGGIWIVYADESGQVLSRHQLTTDMSDVRHRENSVTTNADQVIRDFRDNVQDLYGRGNVSQEMLELIRSRLLSVKNVIASRVYPPQLGPQIQDMTIQRLYIDPVNIDNVWVEVDLDLPEPLNILNLKFRIF